MSNIAYIVKYIKNERINEVLKMTTRGSWMKKIEFKVVCIVFGQQVQFWEHVTINEKVISQLQSKMEHMNEHVYPVSYNHRVMNDFKIFKS